VQERLVEHWLTNVNELGYQIPFCEVLTARGYDVIHLSTHGRGEHGKDIVARTRHGRLHTFQLKGEVITLPKWREMRAEVEELVRLPVRLPGVSESEPHTPYLVTNCEIRGDAIEDIVLFRNEWVRLGAPRLRVISRRTLLRYFLDAQGRFLPTALAGFRLFVELFVGDFVDRLPREKFALLLEEIVTPERTARSAKAVRRAVAGMTVVAGYIAEQYERAGNHVSAAEAWTIAASIVLHVAERDRLARIVYEPILRLLGLALDRNLNALAAEVLERQNMMEHALGIADPFVYGVRVNLTLGWLACSAHRARLLHQESPDAARTVGVIRREAVGLRFVGEVDWPAILLLALYLEQLLNSGECEAILIVWVRWLFTRNLPDDTGAPSPYWLHEQAMALELGRLAPSEHEAFSGRTFTLAAALDMLVRRLRRQAVTQLWRGASQLLWCDFRPDSLADYFRWKVVAGPLEVRVPNPTARWAVWRVESAEVAGDKIPLLLRRHPEWLPPFLMTYPHRTNRTLSAFADSLLANRVRVLPSDGAKSS
jgi:hypothetical protein